MAPLTKKINLKLSRKQILYGIIALFVIILLVRIIALIINSGKQETRGPMQAPVAVKVDSVRYELIQQERQFTGSIHPLYRYIVSPKVSGRIIQVHKRIGDWVNRGDLIATLDDAEYQQAVMEADAALRIAKASLVEAKSQFELSRQELERAKQLQEKGIASPSELDAATTTFEAQNSRLELAYAQVEQREASLKSAQIRLGYTQLSATEPGFIGERFVDEGGLIAVNSSVVSVVGIKKVIVRTTVIERDYGLLRIGQQGKIEVDAYPGKSFTGTVTRIAPMLQEASRVAQMEVEVNNDSLLLKPGMFTRVTIVLEKKSSAQVVPLSALIGHNGANGVYMVNYQDKTARFVAVETGISTEDKVEIVSPELNGLVVTLGQHLLEDGGSVILTGMEDNRPNQPADQKPSKQGGAKP
ncbi:MAG TPA: efflux RND transporter periplasmic adaptor subunit [bacterium]|nr:efflux RND transporter periplasmic adaptor subunit [bacterium]HPN43921.1 efflux RND transporter periplasmic adaptor subunit [bacterium]